MAEESPQPQDKTSPAAVPVKKAAPEKEAFSDTVLLDLLQKTLPDVILESYTFLGQDYLCVAPESLPELAELLKEDPLQDFNLLEDLTAVDYSGKEKRFELVYVLFSLHRQKRLFLKTSIAEGVAAPSLTGVWKAADWAERELYDMFGVRFEGHPDLKRILLPDGWHGHPLRKEYGLAQQDEEWIRENFRLIQPQSHLHIPSHKEIEHLPAATSDRDGRQ